MSASQGRISMNKLCHITILMILLASFAAAQEDFTATAQKQYTLCPCSGQGYYVTLQNTGTTPSAYSFSVSNEAEDWVTISPQKTSLSPKASARIAVFVNTPC